jgi:hypothetical protein
MTSVFIVRPFGKKRVAITEGQSVEVDFDAIDQALIKRALAGNGLEGETTEVIAAAGNIRVDMFEMLITYDLVIADISIDNANVFYELGIRHGLRPKGTILLRFSTPGKDTPFDLKTDRYIAYDRNDPGAAVALLTQSIKETVLSIHENGRADSPVFGLLPALSPPDPASLVVVPRSFQEAVEQAEAQPSDGATTLALLGNEARRVRWGREGLRLVGRAERRLSAFDAARETWEAVRKDLSDDIEANLMLATIYQRFGNNVMASQACRRVLENKAAPPAKRADAHSQLARNEKAAWVKDFAALETQDAQQQAISDQRLIDALEGYQAGFTEDLNDYYSGLNALGLVVALEQLAESQPDSWASLFPNGRRASAALDDYRDQLKQLIGAVRISLDNAKSRSDRRETPDEWLLVSEAQYRLLTADNPGFVRNAYRAAKNALGERFQLRSELSQVAIFHRWVCSPITAALRSRVSGRRPPISSRKSRRRATAWSLRPGTAPTRPAGRRPAASRTQPRASTRPRVGCARRSRRKRRRPRARSMASPGLRAVSICCSTKCARNSGSQPRCACRSRSKPTSASQSPTAVRIGSKNSTVLSRRTRRSY